MSTQRYKVYPAYEDSEVEYIGEIPAGWEVKRLRYVADLNPSPSEVRGLSADTDVSFVPMEAIGEYGGIDLTQTKSFGDVGSGYTYFADGDVIVAKITPCFENGKGALATDLFNGVAFGTTELHVLRCHNVITPRYLFYVTISDAFRRLGQAEMYGAGGQKRVPELFVENLKWGIPPVQEQSAIAAFLDRETTRIDELVAKKERLVELLQERRTVHITHAVTKGLDPKVPVKDSGVKWIGEIPTHWRVAALSRVTLSRCDGPFGSALKSEHYVAEGTRVVRLQNIGFAQFDDSDQAFLTEEYAAQLGDHAVEAHDLLIAGLGDEGHPVGRACVAPRNLGAAMVKADCFRFRLDRREISPEFAALQLSVGAEAVSGSESTGATRSRMNLTAISRRKIALPPLTEQEAIVKKLEALSERQDRLVAAVRDAIGRLKEYRTALISAAVTGKIDVRGEVE